MLELTEFQKWIIDAILSNEINSYRSFSYKYGEIVKMKIDTKLSDREVPKKIHHYFQNSKENYINSLKEYFSLVIKLSKNNLIILIHNKISNKEDFLTMKDTDFMSYEMEDYRHMDILTLPELASFVKRGYVTYNEYISGREMKRPWKIAGFITALTLLINIAVLLLQMWFFARERGAVNKNTEVLKESINVKINDEVKVVFKDADIKVEKKKEKKPK